MTGLVDKKDAIDVISLDFCKPLILSYLTFSSTDWGDLISASSYSGGAQLTGQRHLESIHQWLNINPGEQTVLATSLIMGLGPFEILIVK